MHAHIQLWGLKAPYLPGEVQYQANSSTEALRGGTSSYIYVSYNPGCLSVCHVAEGKVELLHLPTHPEC